MKRFDDKRIYRIWGHVKRFFQRAFGYKSASEYGSNQRRIFVRICLISFVFYCCWLVFYGHYIQTEYSAALLISSVAFIIGSILIFFQVVLLMPFRDDGDRFKVNPRRLLFDTLVSSLFMIAAFSLLYLNIGLMYGGATITPSAIDALYFSAVTFSTLGYGDFAPTAEIRIISAAQALLGNLHLGMIVGATFAAIRR